MLIHPNTSMNVLKMLLNDYNTWVLFLSNPSVLWFRHSSPSRWILRNHKCLSGGCSNSLLINRRPTMSLNCIKIALSSFPFPSTMLKQEQGQQDKTRNVKCLHMRRNCLCVQSRISHVTIKPMAWPIFGDENTKWITGPKRKWSLLLFLCSIRHHISIPYLAET